jgi:RNA polymerase sigma-70 factor (ECF subfamily)
MPSQPIEQQLKVDTTAASVLLDPAVMDQLWRDSGAGDWGLSRGDFDRLVLLSAMRQNFGLPSGAIAGKEEQAAYFRGIKISDLVLASACAEGNERAWEHFIRLYRAQLTRAAIAISGGETVGRDLADAFYAELYGLNTRDGVRKCPLASYRGRGSLLGWLRTTLSQRFVDHYRRTFREEALDETHDLPATISLLAPDSDVVMNLREAIQDALSSQPAEERFVLAAYFVDGRTLAEIGKILHVHEATISRKLRRTTEAVRKSVLKSLEKRGMSHRAAEEALGTDPRDIELRMDLRKLLQYSAGPTFSGQGINDPADENTRVREALLTQSQDPSSTEAGGER